MVTGMHYFLAAAYAPNITPRHFQQWLTVFPTLQSIYNASREEWQALGMSAEQMETLAAPPWQQVEEALTWMQGDACRILTLADADYPVLLKEISDPPLVLFVRGNAAVLSSRQIAMVGSRAVSSYGAKHAEAFAFALARAGLVITSGLARGVDAASHRGTLKAGGMTIAVNGTGLMQIYPPAHRRLADEIVEKGGALVSEFPLKAGPIAYHFPRRNRIISGMSKGVLVVEAARRSGSLITARHAVEQGRDVFAVPGCIDHPLAEGPHALIRQGARLVEVPEDILEEFGMDLSSEVEISRPLAMMPETLSSDEQIVYSHVGSAVTSMDEIILRSGLTAGAVSSILLSIELKGYIQPVTGGYKRQ